MKLNASQHRTAPVSFLLACAIVSAVGNLLFVPVMDDVGSYYFDVVFIYVWLGSLAAQVGLHAVWCVFAPVAVYTRFAVAAVLGLLWFGAWAVGLGVTMYHHPFLEDEFWIIFLGALLCLPLIAVAVQAPLWLTRSWLRWRICYVSEGLAVTGTAAVRIRHIMLFTAAAAVALGMVRLATSVAGEPELLFNMMVGAVWAMANSLLIVLPMLVATLKSGRLWLSLPAAVLFGGGAYAAFAIARIVISGSPPDREALWGVAGTLGSLYICLASVLLVLRVLGYRLEWGMLRHSASAEGSGANAPSRSSSHTVQ
jgi:hypothetical protein